MRLEARAYAKINWLLEVGGVRPDGYHELLTLFQTVDLYDELTIEPATELSLELADKQDHALLKPDDSNLVMRAARLLQAELGRVGSKPLPGAHIRLKKRIPLAAGLGGGSADAAATLAALNEFWHGGLARAKLAELGAQLGSDVPFFLTGGTAWGRGRGTEILPIEDIPAPFLLLVNPRVEVSTAAAYHAFDQLTNIAPVGILTACSFLNADELLTQAHNSLAPVVAALYPAVASVEAKLVELGGKPVLMSGSGATVWARFSSHAQLSAAVEALKNTGWLVIQTRAFGRDEYWRSIVAEVA